MFPNGSTLKLGRRGAHSPLRACLLLLVIAFTVSHASAQTWWDGDWGARRAITFDNSGLGNLVDFPVLVALDGSRIDYARTQDAGEDLRFLDADGTTLLAHEIEEWNETGTSYVWVRVPQIDGGSTSDRIYLFITTTPSRRTVRTKRRSGMRISSWSSISTRLPDRTGTRPPTVTIPPW